MKANAKDYRRSRERLTLEDLGGEETMAVTCTSVEEVVFDDNGRPRKVLVMNFEEFTDKSHWLNETQVKYLCEALGDETDEWVGEKIAIERHSGKFRGEEYEKVWIAAPERWLSILPPMKPKAKGKPAKR